MLRAQSQQQLNQQAEAAFEKADAGLNKIYGQLLAGADQRAAAKLKASQRAWLAYRDAQAEFAADHDARDGSMYRQIYAGQRSALTKVRIKELGESLPSP